MSYYGSEIDREISRIVEFWRGEVRMAMAQGLAAGVAVGVLIGWWLI